MFFGFEHLDSLDHYIAFYVPLTEMYYYDTIKCHNCATMALPYVSFTKPYSLIIEMSAYHLLNIFPIQCLFNACTYRYRFNGVL